MRDELDLYLRNRYPNNYWSGDKDCNLLIWGADGTVPKMCSLNYGIEYDPLTGKTEGQNVKDILNAKYKTHQMFKRLISYGTKLAQKCNIPFVVIVYPSMRKEYDGRWEATETLYNRNQVTFYWYKLGEIGECISGEELKKRIYCYFGKLYKDEGTSKDKNKRLSDYFHYWSRESLSGGITKIDVDGVIVDNSGENGVLIEIKRSSKPPIPIWKPYLSDKSNYALESRYSKMIDAYFWLLHHESRACHDKEIISFYDIKDVNEKCTEDFLITENTVLEYCLTGEDSLDVRIEKFIGR